MTTSSYSAANSASSAANLNEAKPGPAKKRRLRPPGEAFKVNSGPADDPAVHNGRLRAKPHVEGQWSTHIYLEPKASKALVETLENAIAQVTDTLRREHGIAVHSMLTGVSKQSQNLHLSLSRPIQLWTGQRGAFSSACLAAMMGVKRFGLSFASFEILTNDELTRSFLVCEVGYGHDKLVPLTNAFNEVLERRHLPKYYAEPRFHISIAWWLHDENRTLSSDGLKDLDRSLGEDLRKHVLEATNIKLKIGKEVATIQLQEDV